MERHAGLDVRRCPVSLRQGRPPGQSRSRSPWTGTDSPVDLTVTLPDRWWWTDLRFRQSSVDPRLDFEDRPLTDAEKRKLGLKPDGFASQVKYVAEFAKDQKDA